MLRYDSLIFQVKFLLVQYSALFYNDTLVTNFDTLIHYSLLQQLITTISFLRSKCFLPPISQLRACDNKHRAEKNTFVFAAQSLRGVYRGTTLSFLIGRII